MAAIKDIRHRASGYTYSDYIYAPSKLDNKPFAAYSDKQDSIPIALEEIETISIKKMSDGSGRDALICNAKLRIEIPAAVADVMKLSQHQKMRVLDNAKGKFGDRSVHFDNMRLMVVQSQQTFRTTTGRGRYMSSRHLPSMVGT